MRSELVNSFAREVKERIGRVVAELGLELAGEVEVPEAEAACLFESSSLRLKVQLASGHVLAVYATWERRHQPRRRPCLFIFRSREPSKFDTGILAEALDLKPLNPHPVRNLDTLRKELDRLADWLQSYGQQIVAADDSYWNRVLEMHQRLLKRQLKALRDRDMATMIDRRREEAEAAKQRGDLVAMVEAYEAIENWLVLTEVEELDLAREKLADRSPDPGPRGGKATPG